MAGGMAGVSTISSVGEMSVTSFSTSGKLQEKRRLAAPVAHVPVDQALDSDSAAGLR